jgi:hypothetical protein
MEAPSLDGAIAQRAPLGLAEIAARCPADVRAPWARRLQQPPAVHARKLVLLAAAKALDAESLHGRCIGSAARVAYAPPRFEGGKS